jgi:hypothetical protein
VTEVEQSAMLQSHGLDGSAYALIRCVDASNERIEGNYPSRAGLRYNNQYAPATSMAPPTMFPIVTAVRLAANPAKVRLGNMAGVACAMSQKASDAACFTINPKPMKYMLATACSNPAATKAAIGNTVSIARWAGSRLDSDNQMARQTSVLQSMPVRGAKMWARLHFSLAPARLGTIPDECAAASQPIRA